MPIYEYECCECEHLFEQKQGFDEKPVQECPQCGGKAKRIIRSVPIIFKGSGFYVTDNPKSGETEKRKASVTGKSETEKREAPVTGKSETEKQEAPVTGKSETEKRKAPVTGKSETKE